MMFLYAHVASSASTEIGRSIEKKTVSEANLSTQNSKLSGAVVQWLSIVGDHESFRYYTVRQDRQVHIIYLIKPILPSNFILR